VRRDALTVAARCFNSRPPTSQNSRAASRPGGAQGAFAAPRSAQIERGLRALEPVAGAYKRHFYNPACADFSALPTYRSLRKRLPKLANFARRAPPKKRSGRQINAAVEVRKTCARRALKRAPHAPKFFFDWT
jgi:hypothetical protein